MQVTTLANRVAKTEGKKVQVNIAQIKEVLRCTRDVLKEVGIDFYAVVRNAGRG